MENPKTVEAVAMVMKIQALAEELMMVVSNGITHGQDTITIPRLQYDRLIAQGNKWRAALDGHVCAGDDEDHCAVCSVANCDEYSRLHGHVQRCVCGEENLRDGE